mmetsp:Transcript_11374/g.24635  ORF Transcript_11374/g.24635 Transcript_11374/m.24635 type:complete len:480 (+) Transcript_11374:105-1544(+)|eukprot:CAMPEP_0178521008 /NCGR_PEP_ID=MMETSP0696-20121128/27716_1 /TAXON_ID=265572 /ORGANISM="Extubocellulus spinifer, Strain CCMP396" /LENGTH=479 /DNA_ID=CAMNT_0020151919 /DNA_START=52 /DNA_END=1494 /DNA_ORIENTATION=+
MSSPFHKSTSYDGSQSTQSQSLSGRRIVRQNSFHVFRDSVLWIGEQAQTQFLDRNLEAFAGGDDNGSTRTSSSIPKTIIPSYSSLGYDERYTIRCQVILWSIGSPDVKNDRVSMKFRVTLFWNDPPPEIDDDDDDDVAMNEEDDDGVAKSKRNNWKTKKRSQSIWIMSGRSTAYQKKISEGTSPVEMIDVPPISIVNADSFDIIGSPEVQLLREDSRLMRWSCMYRAQLHQNEISVKDFPHDEHNLVLKLGILSQRQPGGRWDRRKWKLALANESDTQGTIRVPYGLLVDNVKIPEFHYDENGLEFELIPLKHGSSLQSLRDQDYYLSVKLRVKRDSGYYDKNIMPLLSILNLVSISILTLNADDYFQRGLMSLNIAFLEVGLRMTLDSHLPSVGYQIKMQRILNFFFYSILWIVLESSILKFLVENEICSLSFTRKIDLVMAIFLLCNQLYLHLVYVSFHRLRQTAHDALKESYDDRY